ncbi:MAG: SH3 domain-containing protein [Fibrobacterota bacterium]
MRTANKFFLLLMVGASLSFAQEQFYVRPVRSIGIYENRTREVNEQAITEVDENNRLRVTDSQGRYYYVVFESENTEGWVEQRNVARTDGKAYTFDNVTVQGYMDNPTVLSVQDQMSDLTAPIDIDRDFKDAMRQQVDKEEVMRSQY